MEVPQLHIRKSPLSIIQYLIYTEIISFILFYLPATIFDYEKLYNTISFSSFLTYQIVFFFFIILITLVPLAFMFIYWFRSYFTLEKDKITIHHLFSDITYEVSAIKSIKVIKKGISGWLNTGSILIEIEGNGIVNLKNISDPVYYSNLIESTYKYSKQTKIDNQIPISEIVKIDENKNLEFKSSLNWDIKRKTTNKEIIRSVMKTIAAFMNSEGGTLVIGITDAKEIVGLENDIKTLKKKDLDGFQNFFTILFNDYVGAEMSGLINIRMEKIEDKDICIINVSKSKSPIYIKNGQTEEFFIRVGNATYPLSIKGATQYISNHFEKN